MQGSGATAALVWATSLAACSCTPSGGGPGVSDFVCSPDLGTLFEPPPPGAEPVWGNVELASAAPRPADASIITQSELPWQYSLRSFYSLNLGEPAYVRLHFLLGEANWTDGVRARVLVEGRPVDVVVGGERVGYVDVELPEGRGVRELVIPPDALSPGLNRVDVALFLSRRGGRRLHMGSPFSIANGSTEPATEYPDSPGLEVGEYVRDTPSRVYRTVAPFPAAGEVSFASWVPGAAPLDDPTRVILRLQAHTSWTRCDPSNRDRLVLVAFRDMEPVPMGGLERVAVTVAAGEQRVYRFDLPPFVEDGTQHHYGIALMAGFGQPARDFEGRRTGWDRTDVLSNVFWGWRPEPTE